jgi:hypothetical protein
MAGDLPSGPGGGHTAHPLAGNWPPPYLGREVSPPPAMPIFGLHSMTSSQKRLR